MRNIVVRLFAIEHISQITINIASVFLQHVVGDAILHLKAQDRPDTRREPSSTTARTHAHTHFCLYAVSSRCSFGVAAQPHNKQSWSSKAGATQKQQTVMPSVAGLFFPA